MNNEETLYRTTKLVWYVFYVLEALLVLRFLLKLLGANPAAGFTNFVYSLSAIPLAPFRFVFETNQVAGSVLEWSTLLAMVVYWFIAWGIVKLLLMGRDVEKHEVERSLDQQDHA